jgi:hypothetical protein
MTEETQKPSVSDMIRLTSDNSSKFMLQIAEHLDKLEATIVELTTRVNELEGTQNGTK